MRHPVRKDVTDGELAVDEALRRGAGEVLLAGATGALDHTLGHLAILRRLASRGVAARLVAPDLTVTVLIAPAAVALDAPAGTRVSVSAVGEAATVTLTGLDYPLDHGVLPADACLGLGNHVAAAGDARIVLHEGTVVVLVDRATRRSGRSPPGARSEGHLGALARAAAGWAVVIFVSGVLPTADTVNAVSAGHDTLTTTAGHFVAYALLGFLLGLALGGWRVDSAAVGPRPRARGCARGGDRAGAGAAVLSRRAARRLPRRRRRRRGRTRRLQRCRVGDATTIASRMMLAATSSAGTS